MGAADHRACTEPGRQADALATYQRVRNQLAEELGLDPRPQLQELEQRILVQDAVTRPRLPSGRHGSNAARSSREPAVDDCRARRSRRRRWRQSPTCSPVSGSWRSWDRAASGRRRSRSRSAAGWPRRPTAIWLARLETRHHGQTTWSTCWSARSDGPGGEAALFERLKDSSAVVILDNCEHVIDAAADSGGAPPRRRTGAADPVHQPGPTRHRRRGRLRARAAGARRRGRAVHPPGHGTTPSRSASADRGQSCSTCAALSTVCPWRSSSPRRGPRRCPSRRSPAASTTGSSS